MIAYLEHNAIDRAKWDALIRDHGMIYAQSWYLDVVHPGWSALVLDDYEAVMPITGGKKFGVSYLFQPFFVQQLGVFAKQGVSPEMIQDFLDAIPKTYRFAEIRLNESNTLDCNIQNIEYHRNIVLFKNQDYDAIRAHYHTNTKRNLLKAESNDLQIVDYIDLKHIVKLFRTNRGASVRVWGNEEYATLINLGEIALGRGAAFTIGVTERGSNELICGALFMQTASRVTFLFSGNSERGKETQAMTFLLDQAIRRFVHQPLTFDFEGSDDDNLARFYLGFGGQEVKYPAYTFNRLSPLGKALLRLWKSC